MPQFDITIDSLTAGEHLHFMCELRLDKNISKYNKKMKITNILSKMGLTKVENSKISVLSGGERKKLNLATEVSSLRSRSIRIFFFI